MADMPIARFVPRQDARSTDPIKVINDVAILVDHLLGIAQLLECVDVDVSEGAVQRVGHAMEGILRTAADRLAEAKLSDRRVRQ